MEMFLKLAKSTKSVMVARMDKETYTSAPGTNTRHKLLDALRLITKDLATLELPLAWPMKWSLMCQRNSWIG